MAPAPQTAPQKIAGVIRTPPKKTSRKPKSPLSRSGNAASGELLVRAEEKLLPTADRLKAAIETSLAAAPDMSMPRRRSIQEVLALTVPDPVEIGLE